MTNYILMHKNNECGIISIDEEIGKLSKYVPIDEKYAPFLGNTTNENMRRWWEMRSIPASRETIKTLIHSLEVVNAEEYLAKNLALSVTDTYWIKPLDANLHYEDINFFCLKQYNEGKIPYHNVTSYDPNASLGGQMEKYWDLNHDVPVLVKEAYKYFGQQAINEVFATWIHECLNQGIPYVKYTALRNEAGGIDCRCNAFTSKDVEFISAYEVLSSQKVSTDTNMYQAFIDICDENGLDKLSVRDFLDYQTLTDFLISNTDEHMMNFGILRNANTMELIGPAPIFDSGNSMFYSDLKNVPFTRAELLERKITSFYSAEEKMLKNITNRSLTIDALPTPSEVKEFYIKHDTPENRADLIATNYGTKYQMLKEFITGKTISLYDEKRRAKESKNTNDFNSIENDDLER
ncbi:hypothetical protein SAMN02910301_2223 [Lachnospiraceae bacterium XBD2001]|nr:hypothetical protein SAMN02910301_2223 [Lachnospiraceae bacterium XBD2001]